MPTTRVLCVYAPDYLMDAWVLPLPRIPLFVRQVVIPFRDRWCNIHRTPTWYDRQTRAWRRYRPTKFLEDGNTFHDIATQCGATLLCRFGPGYYAQLRDVECGWAFVTPVTDYALKLVDNQDLLRPAFWREQAYLARMRSVL